jgi:hypothetical protein
VVEQGGNTIEQQNPDENITPPPPFPERLMIAKPTVYHNIDIVGELKILYVKIPLLQTFQDIPIYAKTIKEICGKKPVGKFKIHQLFTWYEPCMISFYVNKSRSSMQTQGIP